MITLDPSPVFPGCPTFGFTAKQRLLVKKTQLESGRVRRDRKWAQGLRLYEGLPLGQRPQADIEDVLNFYWALAGEATVFRFKDWSDFKSCALDDEPTPIDQGLQVVTGSPGGLRLAKAYTVGAYTEYRFITRPKGDTIRIANEIGVEQPSSTWTIDEATGILTTTGGFAGDPSAWGGEFFVPVAFEGDLPIEITNFKVQSSTITLMEQREADAD